MRFLLEACGDQRLQAGIDEALRRVAARRKHIAPVQSIRRRLRQLAPPLREVFELLVRGKPNREIAEDARQERPLDRSSPGQGHARDEGPHPGRLGAAGNVGGRGA